MRVAVLHILLAGTRVCKSNLNYKKPSHAYIFCTFVESETKKEICSFLQTLMDSLLYEADSDLSMVFSLLKKIGLLKKSSP